MPKCDLFLDNYRNFFTAGQQIVGRVAVTLESKETVEGVICSFQGAVHTEWSETESHYNSTTKKHESTTVRYVGQQPLLEYTVNLVGSTSLRSGAHSFPFSFTLPAQLPATFHGIHGKITYKVKAVLQRALLKFNSEAESEIIVKNPIILMQHPNLMKPIHISDGKTFGCLCFCKSGPLDMDWKLPYTGFAPGQRIPINIYVSNMSNNSVDAIEIKLSKKITFRTQVPSTKTKSIGDTIVKKSFDGVGAHGDRTYDEFVIIPASYDPPNFEGNNLISIKTTLTLTLELPLCTIDMENEIAVTIGNVPLDPGNTPPSYPGYTPTIAANVQSAPPMPSAPSDYGATASCPPMPMPGGMPENVPVFGWQIPGDVKGAAEAPPPTYNEALMKM